MAIYPDTYGWDTVFAISVAKVNSILAKVPGSPKTYSASTDITVGSNGETGTATLSWGFRPWFIESIKDNQLVLKLILDKTSVLDRTGGALPAHLPVGDGLWGCRVTIQPFWEVTDTTSRLIAKTDTGQSWAEVELISPSSDFDVNFAMTSILTDWFDDDPAAIALFSAEFASINMSAETGNLELPWLVPKHMGFAAGKMQDGTLAVGLLAMTIENKPTSAGQLQLSPFIIASGADAGFLISRQLVMENLMLPGIAGAYSGDTPKDKEKFRISGDHGERIENIVDLSFSHDLDGKPQTCTISNGGLTAVLDGEFLTLKTTKMEMTTVHPGFVLHADLNESLQIALVDNAKDPTTKNFFLNDTNPAAPVISYDPTLALQIGLGIVGALVSAGGIALGVVSFSGPLRQRFNLATRTAKIVARIIAAIVAGGGLFIGLIPQIEHWVLNGRPENLPDIGPMMNTQLARINWPGKTKVTFLVVNARFANGIQMTVAPQNV